MYIFEDAGGPHKGAGGYSFRVQAGLLKGGLIGGFIGGWRIYGGWGNSYGGPHRVNALGGLQWGLADLVTDRTQDS